MTTVLVTGGSGVLGQPAVRALVQAGADVRVLSRRAAISAPPPGVTWTRGDLLTGEGLAPALRGVDAVLHAATLPGQPEQDALLTGQLLRAAQEEGGPHVVYASIVGVDALPDAPYYAAKLESEARLAASGLPLTVQRATQFHEFAAFLLGLTDRGPLHVIPRGLRLQPVQVEAVAEALARAALSAPAGRLRDMAGPEVLTGPQLARAWQKERGTRRPVLALPLPLPAQARALTSGKLVNPQAERVGGTWGEWLRTHAKVANPYAGRG